MYIYFYAHCAIKLWKERGITKYEVTYFEEFKNILLRNVIPEKYPINKRKTITSIIQYKCQIWKVKWKGIITE